MDEEMGSTRRLLILIARSEAALDELVTGMLDVGITGATVVESKGLGAILRQDMPMFAGLAALLPQHTGSRVVISLTTTEEIEQLRTYVDDMEPDQQPIAIAIPVAEFWGPIRA